MPCRIRWSQERKRSPRRLNEVGYELTSIAGDVNTWHTKFMRLLSSQNSRSEDEVLRLRQPKKPREPLRPARPRDDTQLRLRQPNLRNRVA